MIIVYSVRAGAYRIARIAIALVLGQCGWQPAAGAPGEWSTYLDGSVYHVSPGTGESPDVLKYNPLARQGDDQLWAGSSGGVTGFTVSTQTYTRFFRNDGLPSQDITALAVDSAQNLWIGSRAHGLNARQPDGTMLRRALDQFDLGSDSLRVILALGDELWVGTAAGAARVRFPADPTIPGEGSILERINLASFLGQSPYVNTIAARDDTTWFGTQRGVVRLAPDGTRSLVNDGLVSARDIQVQALYFFADDLWAATRGGVFRLENGSWAARATGVDPARTPLCLSIHDGELMLGVYSGDSVYRLDAASLSWSPLPITTTGVIVAGLLEQAGRLWAATNRGLYWLDDDDTWHALPSVDPPAASFLATEFDYVDVVAVPDGVWALTRTFVTHRDDNGWEGVRRNTIGIEDTDLRRIVLDGEGHLLLCHCCCGTQTTCRIDLLDEDLASGATVIEAYDITSTTIGPDGRVWLGSVQTDASDGEGLYVHDPQSGSLTRYTPSGGDGARALPGMSSTSVTALAFDGRGRLWIGHQFEGVDIWGDPGNTSSSLEHLDQFDNLPAGRITSLAPAGEGAWVGTSSGIALVGGDLFVTRSLEGEMLPAVEITGIAVDGCGRAWVGTGAGLVELDAEANVLAVYDDTSRPGPADERISAVSADLDGGAIWMATRLGLSRVEYDPLCAARRGTSSCNIYCPFPNPVGRGGGSRMVYLTDPPGQADVTIFDALGSTVWSGRAAAGEAIWDARDADGEPVPAGVYLVSLRIDGKTYLRRLAVVH